MSVTPADEKANLKRGVDHIGVGAASVIHDGRGNILLMKRGPNARDERGRWDICGGAIEFGETIEEAVVREVGEELCVKPLEMEFLTAYDAHRSNAGKRTHWVQILYSVKVDPNKVKIGEPDKISEIGWFTSKNLPKPLHSQFQKSFVPAKTAGIVS